jgi:hypothetical protein
VRRWWATYGDRTAEGGEHLGGHLLVDCVVLHHQHFLPLRQLLTVNLALAL